MDTMDTLDTMDTMDMIVTDGKKDFNFILYLRFIKVIFLILFI